MTPPAEIKCGLCGEPWNEFRGRPRMTDEQLDTIEAWPDGIEMIHQLWEAVHGARSSAQPRPPKEVWEGLLERVRGMAQGRCLRCMEIDAAAVSGEGKNQ